MIALFRPENRWQGRPLDFPLETKKYCFIFLFRDNYHQTII